MDPSPAAFSWTIDTVPPNTVIDSGPINPVDLNQRDLSVFHFNGSRRAPSNAVFDGSPFSACSSPKSYAGLVAGSHAFQVRAPRPDRQYRSVSVQPDLQLERSTLSTLTIVGNVTKIYEGYNRLVYLTAAISSSVGQVSEGNVYLYG